MATPKILTASTTKSASPYASTLSPARPNDANVRLVWLFRAAVLLCSVALAISGYLSYVAFTSSKILGCGGGVFSCDHVLTSKWSTLLGLPVAAWAGSMYLGVLTALIATSRSAVSNQQSLLRQWSWSIVTAASVSAGLAAIWFMGLQIFVLEHLCPWCMGAHTCGILLCIGTLFYSPLAGTTKGMCASLGFTGTLGLVVIQLMTPAPLTYTSEDFPPPLEGGIIEEPATFDAPGAESGDVFLAPDAQSSLINVERWIAQLDQAARLLANPASIVTAQVGDQATPVAQNPPAALAASPQPPAVGAAAEPQAAPAQASPRTVHLSGANIKLRPEQWPMLGSPDAPKIFVEMFDYTCKHCRKTQKAVKGARQSLGPSLGVILLPVPLNRNCNPHAVGNPNPDACELAELALAVWKADSSTEKSQFEAFHDWLLEGENAPRLADATAKAQSMVDPQTLAAEKPTAQKFIRSNVDIYKRMNAGPVPKLVFPTTVMTGELQDSATLINTINRQPAAK